MPLESESQRQYTKCDYEYDETIGEHHEILHTNIDGHSTKRENNAKKLTIARIATVGKIITEILPPSTGLTFGKDARDLLIECCVEFITLISSEANDIAEKEAKKTIACEHVEKALTELGFGEYVQSVIDVANEYKEQQKVGFAEFLRSTCLD
jgi:histone H3/H4